MEVSAWNAGTPAGIGGGVGKKNLPAGRRSRPRSASGGAGGPERAWYAGTLAGIGVGVGKKICQQRCWRSGKSMERRHPCRHRWNRCHQVGGVPIFFVNSLFIRSYF
ncbi:MAG: hypothetical protein A2X45_15065 [Lentisphaerae bacterium GWF2_50_93]|nr:MAG: hypothetical protein A2X45_15065 [Lentisphaerae bacterium GWF2_50_93]